MSQDFKKLINDKINELALANYEAEINSIAIVYANDHRQVKQMIVIGPNMGLVMIAGTKLLCDDVTQMVKTEYRKDE